MCKIMITHIRHLRYFVNIATVNICVSVPGVHLSVATVVH